MHQQPWHLCISQSLKDRKRSQLPEKPFGNGKRAGPSLTGTRSSFPDGRWRSSVSFLFRSGSKSRLLRSACGPVVDSLEDRRMFSATTIQPLPYLLDFGTDQGEVLDRDGQGTGFTRLQANKLGNEYQPALIDLDTTAGVLK